MPILDFEPAIFPEGLLDASSFSFDHSDVDRKWWAVYTKPRQEKSLARCLHNWEVPFFLPLIPKRMVYRGRRIQSLLPLFSGYLFLYSSDHERMQTVSTNRVSQLVEVHDAERLVRDLRQVHHVLQTDADLIVEKQLRPGREVRVTSGPFMGLEGTIEACKSGYRLVVGVRLLQRGLSLEIDDALVELV